MKTIRTSASKALAFGTLIFTACASAQATSFVVPDLYKRVAAKHQVPSTLLLAISYQESVLKLSSGKVSPWHLDN